ncbi:MAG: hypothetical protein MZV70_44450 [Desulfobacterales bacterium]|nr:hypothetical protein [Desulfobacterales bacterium]
MKVSQEYHTATLLLNGRVLVAGNRAELYDPVLDTWGNAGTGWSSTGTYFDPFWKNQTATLLQDGQVLLAGGTATGSSSSYTNAKAWLYDPVSVSWTGIALMNTGRQYHTATVLPNGQVLVAGGDSDSNTTNGAEIYEPQPPPRVSLPPLLAFYPFEGDAHDTSGNGRHGTITNSPQVVAGYEGQAYNFNGGADYISVPLDINPSKYPRLTIGAWARNKASGSLQPLVTHDDGGYDRQIGIDHRGGGFGWSAFCGPFRWSSRSRAGRL